MPNRLVVSVLVLSLLGACANRPGLRLDLGQGRTIDYVPRASMPPVVVDEDAFEAAISSWVLDLPLSLRTERQPWLVRAAYPGSTPDARWRSLMRKSFGGICRASHESEDCLSLLADVSGLSGADKLGVALGLSVGPLKSSIAKAVEDTLAPQLFYTVIATGLVTWAMLAANPEPVFTKAAAIISAILLSYLGVESFVVSLPATAVAVVARNGASSNSNPGGPRSWRSFSGLKRTLGPAEDGKQWHHIVEQTPGNVNRFGPEAVHNTENVIQLDQGLHKRLSGFYSSIQQEITGSRTLTVRQWLSTQSFEAQRDFGLQAIEKIPKRIWGVWK
ncbi:hypothetical protein D7V80_22715 [Corallococcus sp. CA054B]|nr:hypothetical protein D7V80_22715 [Corallococcus sp. CA054B]